MDILFSNLSPLGFYHTDTINALAFALYDMNLGHLVPKPILY